MDAISTALGLNCSFNTRGDEYLPSRFAVSDLATQSLGSVGCAIASLVERLGLANQPPAVDVDRRLAALWFKGSIHPLDWELPPAWDAIAGDYQTANGWIKLHTNLPHHRAAVLSVLGGNAVREEVATAIRPWDKDKLEMAIAQAGGASAAMRSRAEWSAHPQGAALAAERLIRWGDATSVKIKHWQASKKRPLNGLRVLDMTRVLAGPVATRTLAGFGANVLRIDPPAWEEPFVVPYITLGKHCARLDLTSASGRQVFECLLADADILVHGYRPGALDNLGYGKADRLNISPDLLEVSLDAYGWTGPWCQRRGFDSLVQMSCGIADAGMHWAGAAKPTPLPVQALDHATGYLMAAAAIRMVSDIAAGEGAQSAQLSLARTADLLFAYPKESGETAQKPVVLGPSDFLPIIEQTPWGKANRLRPAITIANTPMEWDRPSNELGTAPPHWH